jgi:hypothetical protein
VNRQNRDLPPHIEADLHKLVEPLANYICAIDCPRTALLRTLVKLYEEVALIHQAAQQQVTVMGEKHIGEVSFALASTLDRAKCQGIPRFYGQYP